MMATFWKFQQNRIKIEDRTESGPAAALEVVQTEFFLELLMGWLAYAARLDRAGPLHPAAQATQVKLAGG